VAVPVLLLVLYFSRTMTNQLKNVEPPVLLEAEITEENDPFRVRLHFSPLEKIQMLLFLIFVVPFRVLIAFSSLGKY
jgi:hypothetical protein